MPNRTQLIYSHPDFIAVYKPPGVSVHKDDQETPYITFLEQTFQEKKLFLVHRLDKLTSGILLLARSPEAAADLSEQFKNKTITKYYIAISDKKPIKKQGMIKGDMLKARRSAWKLAKTVSNPAITRFISTYAENVGRLFLIQPLTGKTHQIRVALRSIGAPILGDPIYYGGATKSGGSADRMYLHAVHMAFTYQGTRVELESVPMEGCLFLESAVSDQITQWLSALKEGNTIQQL